jgi:hypothetical protein
MLPLLYCTVFCITSVHIRSYLRTGSRSTVHTPSRNPGRTGLVARHACETLAFTPSRLTPSLILSLSLLLLPEVTWATNSAACVKFADPSKYGCGRLRGSGARVQVQYAFSCQGNLLRILLLTARRGGPRWEPYTFPWMVVDYVGSLEGKIFHAGKHEFS